MQKNLQIFTLFLLTILLQACATNSVKPNLGNTKDPNWFFQAKGKIAINMANNNTSANLDWKQNGFNYKIGIFSSFGLGVTIVGSPFFVEASIPTRGKMQASSLDYLIQRGLNFPLPLSNMVYWLKGVNAPGEYVWQEPKQILQQDSWKIVYANYKKVANFPQEMPHKIDMTYGGIKIKIVIKQWQKL